MEEPALLTAVLLFVASSVEAGIAGVEASLHFAGLGILHSIDEPAHCSAQQQLCVHLPGLSRASVPGAKMTWIWYEVMGFSFNQPVVLGQDMVGFARLNRAQKIVEAAPCLCSFDML